MDIRCKKKIDINKYEAILKLQALNERLDVAKFLEEKLESEEDLDIKIKEQFMKKKDLIKADLRSLTKEGEKVVKTKMMWENHMGEYNLYTLEDNFISKIIGIEAINAYSSKSNTEKFNNKVISFEVDSKINNKKYKIMEEINYVKKDESYKEKIDIEWNLNKNKEEIKIKLPENFKSNTCIESKGINHDIFIKDYIKVHGMKYNEELKKIEYGEEFKKFSENEINRFTCNTFDINGKVKFELENKEIEFDEIKISNIGIMPDSKECAEKWGLYNLKSQTNKKYITEKEYKSISSNIYNKNEIKYWDTGTLSIENFIKNNFEELNKNNCFWNVAAPFDLSSRNILSGDVFQFNNGENSSLKGFIDKINIAIDKVRDVILIDNYVFTDKKKGKLLDTKIKIVEILNSIINPQNSFVIYAQEADLKEVKGRINHHFNLENNESLEDKHPRYLFFIMNNGEEKLFTIDRSIDFINYENIEFNENTKGISKSFTISAVEKEKLDKSIQNILKERAYNE